MTRRFRLDSATAWEVSDIVHCHQWHRDNFRGDRLLLHWWGHGHDPARALRCPECHGSGMALLVQERSPYRYAGDPRCHACRGRGWSMPHERGTRG